MKKGLIYSALLAASVGTGTALGNEQVFILDTYDCKLPINNIGKRTKSKKRKGREW